MSYAAKTQLRVVAARGLAIFVAVFLADAFGARMR